ncbi:hypothetical protein PMAYCL1PPCAC_23534, partial [Pristionchus mayeri]
SGVGSALPTNGVTPVTSKKRPLTKTTPNIFSKKRKTEKDRSKWIHFSCDVTGDDFLTKGSEVIRSEGVMIEGSEWYLTVHRRVNEVESSNPFDENSTEKNLMVEATLNCVVPSAAWCAKCKIDLEVTTNDNNFLNKSFDCTITSSSHNRGVLVDWRKYFLRGGRVSTYLLISRVCNKYLCFPDFSDPDETGHDELLVGNQILYVDKSLLSLHSKFFALWFSTTNGPYHLNGRVEDVIATLQTIYPQKGVIDASNVCTIASAAKEFEFYETLERCEQFLLSSDNFSTLEKTEAALKCHMHSLLSQCSEGLDSIEDVFQLMEDQKEGFVASEKTKAFLFDRVLALNKKKKEDEVALA